jgi:hypothetical protein
MNRLYSLIKVILGFNLISVFSLARSPCAFVRAASHAFSAAYRVWRPEGKIPCISIERILGSRKPDIRMRVMAYEPGMLPSHEAMVLLAIAVAENPDAILEIGTYMGHTTKLLAENLPDATIHTVDLPLEADPVDSSESAIPRDDHHLIHRRVVGREFVGQPCELQIRQHLHDTASWDFAAAVDASLYFIDGSHTYEYVKNDSEKCLEKCRGAAVFLWHDCDDLHPGIQRFIREWRAIGRDVRLIADTTLAYRKVEQ